MICRVRGLLQSSRPPAAVPTLSSILDDKVFRHVLADVQALQRNDLRLACLMAVYCEEFCSCAQLKQVLPTGLLLLLLLLTHMQMLQLLDDPALRVKFTTFVFSRPAEPSTPSKTYHRHSAATNPTSRSAGLGDEADVHCRIVDPGNKSVWARAVSSKERKVWLRRALSRPCDCQVMHTRPYKHRWVLSSRLTRRSPAASTCWTCLFPLSGASPPCCPQLHVLTSHVLQRAGGQAAGVRQR